MVVLDILFAIIIALVLAGFVLAFAGLGRPRDGARMVNLVLLLFSILFFTVWAGGMWIPPIGPPLWGVPWLSFLVVGLVTALILASMVPRAPRTAAGAAEATPGESTLVMSVFFWMLLVILALAVVAAYAV